LEEGKLTRLSWNLVDHLDAEPITMTLIEDVESFELRLLDPAKQWQKSWKSNKNIPLAVELNLEHKYWGKIVRLIPVK
jgi:type II secretion system protein J